MSKRKKISKEEFIEELRKSLFYYFCSKCEYEVIISPWVGIAEDIKIDAYDQVMLNWNKFVDYIWNYKGENKNEQRRNL